MTLIENAFVWLSILGPWYYAWYCAWYAGKLKNARSAEAQRDGASSAWDSAGVAAVAFVVAAIIIWAASRPIWRALCATAVQKTAAPEQREEEERRTTEAAPCVPVPAHGHGGGNRFLALPDDVLALVLFGEIDIQAQLQVVLRAGACCKAFAACVREASAIIAARYGWCLPPDGIPLMRHLSKVEHDTKWVRSILRDDSSSWWSDGIGSESATRLLEFARCWNQEASLGFVGPLFIYPEVRRQHIQELSKLLIELATSVCENDPYRDEKISSFMRPLVGIMAQPGTPLDTLWLAPRVFLLVKKHMEVNGVWLSTNEAIRVRKTRLALLDLLGFLEPHVLRSDPVTFKWLIRTLQSLPKTRLTATGGVIKVENPLNGRSETMWNAGLAAWNKRCEAQRLQLRRSSGDEGHDVTLEAIRDKQIRGCFVSCGWSNAQQLQPDQTADDVFLGSSPPGWSDGSWWSVASHEIYHAVYHDSPVGRVPQPRSAPQPAPRLNFGPSARDVSILVRDLLVLLSVFITAAYYYYFYYCDHCVVLVDYLIPLLTTTAYCYLTTAITTLLLLPLHACLLLL
jgi:hypothetical protein